jgi:hypothetical protein
MRKLLFFLVALLLITGCSPFFKSPESTKAPLTMATPIPEVFQEEPTVTFTSQVPKEPQPERTASILATETFQPALPEMLKVRPEEIHHKSLCPNDDFVPVQDLGIPPNLGLLLADGNVSDSEAEISYPIFLYKPATQLPGKQLTLNQAKKIHSVPIASPDGRFFYYLQYDKGQPARTLVVQSTDGQTRKIVLEREYPFGYPYWIDDHHILWNDIPDPEIYWSFGGRPDDWDYIPTHLIDVQTLETQELPPIRFLKKDGYYTVQDFTHTATGNYAFLQHANLDQISYEIYSFATQNSQPIFPWLPVKFLRDLKDTRKNITPNGRLYFIALDGNVFWIVSQVSVEQVFSGKNALADHVYEFTFPVESTPSFIPYYFDTRNSFLYTQQSSISKDILEAVPQYLYRLDIDSQTINDYCFDIQKWRGGASMSVSPGEEFVAITLYQDPMTGRGSKDTILINLSTGDRAILPNYQVFDWVSVNN